MYSLPEIVARKYGVQVCERFSRADFFVNNSVLNQNRRRQSNQPPTPPPPPSHRFGNNIELGHIFGGGFIHSHL